MVPAVRIVDIIDHISLFDSLICSKVAHIEVVVLVQLMLLNLPLEIRSIVVSVLYPSYSHYDTWTEPRLLLYYHCVRVAIAIVQDKAISLTSLCVSSRCSTIAHAWKFP